MCSKMMRRPLPRSFMSVRAEGNAVCALLLAKLAMVIQVRNAASLMSALWSIQSGVWVNTTRLGCHEIVASSMSGLSGAVLTWLRLVAGVAVGTTAM
jgi:hypothetical protein